MFEKQNQSFLSPADDSFEPLNAYLAAPVDEDDEDEDEEEDEE